MFKRLKEKITGTKKKTPPNAQAMTREQIEEMVSRSTARTRKEENLDSTIRAAHVGTLKQYDPKIIEARRIQKINERLTELKRNGGYTRRRRRSTSKKRVNRRRSQRK